MKLLLAGREKILSILSETTTRLPGTESHSRIQRLDSMVDWMMSEGAEIGDIEFKHIGDGEGVGLFTKEEISEGEVWFSSPGKLNITMGTVHEDPIIGEFVKNHDRPLPATIRLALYVLYHKFYAKEPCFFIPYLNGLPDSYFHIPVLEYTAHEFLNTGVPFHYFFSPLKEASGLSGDMNLDSLMCDLELWQETYRTYGMYGVVQDYQYKAKLLMEVLREMYFLNDPVLKEVFPQGNETEVQQLQIRFLWAFGVVLSNSFLTNTYEEEILKEMNMDDGDQSRSFPSLCPLLDSINTSGICEKDRAFESISDFAPDGSIIRLMERRKKETGSLSKEEEIQIHYGEPNHMLFRDKGFVLEDNPDKSVWFHRHSFDVDWSLEREYLTQEAKHNPLDEETKQSIRKKLTIQLEPYKTIDWKKGDLKFMIENEKISNGVFSSFTLMKQYLEFEEREILDMISFFENDL